MYKLAGVLCILIGCIGWGNGRIGQERERIRHLKALLHILERIRSEITYGKRTLPEICLLLTEEKEECYRSCFRRIYECSAAENGTGFPGAWEAELGLCLKKLPLREDERETLVRLPDALGFQEESGQAGGLGQTEAFLAKRCAQAEESYENRTKMIRSVSILTGLLLAIWLL